MRARRHPRAVTGLTAALAIGFLSQTCAVARAASAAVAPEALLSGGSECDANSRYMWRGLALSEGAVAQPSVWLSRSGFTMTLWGSGALDSRDPSGFHELDPSLGYERELGGWSLKPSVYLYRYPGTPDPGSTELELVVGHGLFGPVHAIARQTVDVGAYPGANSGAVGVARESESEGAWSWTAGAQLMWNSARFVKAYVGEPARATGILQGTLAVTRHLGKCYLRLHGEADGVTDAVQRTHLIGDSPFSAGAALGAEW